MTRRTTHKRPNRARKSGYIDLRGHDLLRSITRGIYCPECDT